MIIYGTGFGPTNPPVPFGPLAISVSPLANPVSVKIAGIIATVQFAGISAVGECQFNVLVPTGVPAGDQLVVATINGQQTQNNTFISILN